MESSVLDAQVPDEKKEYHDQLASSYVVFRLGGLSRNMRNEATRMDKIYFYDLGVRNSVIDMLKPIHDRNDVGQLWGNFIIVSSLLSYGDCRRLNKNY